jgi:hypothetical protein
LRRGDSGVNPAWASTGAIADLVDRTGTQGVTLLLGLAARAPPPLPFTLLAGARR